MTDLGRSSPGSPRSGYKRDRDFRRSPPRYDRRSPPRPARYDPRERSPPRKKRRDDFDRRDLRRDSPDRRRGFNDRGRGRHSNTPPRRERGSSRGFGGRDIQRYDGPLQTFTQFMDNQEDKPSTTVVQRRYEEYKQEYDKRNSRIFWKQHQEEEWLREKYYPPLLEDRFKEDATNAQKEAEQFLEEIKNGTLSFPNWDAEDIPKDTTKENTSKESSPNINGHKVDEIPTTQEPDIIEAKKENDVKFEQVVENIEKDKEREMDTDKLEVKDQQEVRDEIVKGEISTEPNATEEMKIEKEEIGQGEGVEKDDTKLPKKRRDPSILEPPADPKTLFLPNISTTCNSANLFVALNKVESGKVTRLLINEPKPTKKFIRTGYVTYSTEEAANEALSKINGSMVGDLAIELTPHEPRYESFTPRLTPLIASTPTRIRKDLEQIRTLARILDKNQGIENNVLLGNLIHQKKSMGESNGMDQLLSDDENGEKIIDANLLNLEDRIINKTSEKELLDLFILYLCRVHHFCYYSAEVYPSYDHLLVRAGPARRGIKNNCSSEDPNNWARDLDNKIKQKIAKEEKNSYRKEATAETATEKGLEDLYRDKISKENEERYRCEVCSKMFKAVKFVRKHVDTKHPELISDVKKKAIETQYFNNYVTDPNRILPSAQYLPKKEISDRDYKLDRFRSGRDWPRSPRDDDRRSRDKSPVREGGSPHRSPWTRSRERGSPRERASPFRRSPRDRSPAFRRSPRSPPYRSRERSPRYRSPRDRSPRRSPRIRSPRPRSPRERSRERSPWGRSPRDRSRGPSKSPRERSPRSPRDRSRDRSPLSPRSPRDRSRERSPRRSRPNWSGGRYSRARRYGGGNGDRNFRSTRPRIEYVGRDQQQHLQMDLLPPPEFRDKVDPRSPIVYVDLDRPPEDTFEIDYEKALAAFASGAK